MRRAHEYAVARLRPRGVERPKCGSKDVLFLARDNRRKCSGKHASPQFTLKTGTVMGDSPVALGKRLVAALMLASCENGVSSYEVAEAVGVSQHSCWFMVHGIREAMRDVEIPPMGSANAAKLTRTKPTFAPAPVRCTGATASGGRQGGQATAGATRNGVTSGKTAVQRMLDREGRRVRAAVVPGARRDVLQEEILKDVVRCSRLYADDRPS